MVVVVTVVLTVVESLAVVVVVTVVLTVVESFAVVIVFAVFENFEVVRLFTFVEDFAVVVVLGVVIVVVCKNIKTNLELLYCYIHFLILC